MSEIDFRLERLRQKLTERELNAVLISQAENRRYLSGLTGSAGFLLISQDKALLATDFRYTEQAEREAPGFSVMRIGGEFIQWLPDLVSSLGIKRLGFEDTLSFAAYQKLIEAVSTKGESRLQLIPTEGVVESLRAIKDKEEIECIAQAVELADLALENVIPSVRPGMTEKEVAWELEKCLREKGSEGLPFDIIVASGPNSALPHAKPSDRPIQESEPVVIDMGARVRGYCSDLTRTICLGRTDKTFRKVYDVVLGAQLTAIATLAAGMTGEQVDHLARTVIEQADYGEAFGHGLGHGIGLATHEEPRLGGASSSILSEGTVFTIEPGIYLRGWGGVRIEDVVILEGGRAEVLSKAKKKTGELGDET